MQYVVLAISILALLAAAWSFVLGLRLAIDSSVVGGLAVMLAAAVLMSVVGWRIRFRWGQLREQV